MLDVVTTSFYINASPYERRDFERSSTRLFDDWDNDVEAYLHLPDYSLSLVVEEGSIKGRGTIAATAAALYFAIGSYGDFVSGLHTIREQASHVTKVLFEQARRNFDCDTRRGNSRRSGGEIFYLRDLFERVQNGQITPQQAMDEVKSRWGADAGAAQGFMQDLASSLTDAPRFPEQMSLIDESWELCSSDGVPEKEPRKRFPSPPETPLTEHYRIEIFRPSREAKKKVKLTRMK